MRPVVPFRTVLRALAPLHPEPWLPRWRVVRFIVALHTIATWASRYPDLRDDAAAVFTQNHNRATVNRLLHAVPCSYRNTPEARLRHAAQWLDPTRFNPRDDDVPEHRAMKAADRAFRLFNDRRAHDKNFWLEADDETFE